MCFTRFNVHDYLLAQCIARKQSYRPVMCTVFVCCDATTIVKLLMHTPLGLSLLDRACCGDAVEVALAHTSMQACMKGSGEMKSCMHAICGCGLMLIASFTVDTS